MSKDENQKPKTEKKGFGSRLSGLIFKEEDPKTPTKPAGEVKTNTPPPVTNVPQVAVNIIPSQEYGTGTIDPDLLQKLCKVLDDSNLPGPDYLELKSSAEALFMIPDPNTRFAAAYSALKVNFPVLDKARVINSLTSYIEIMNEQKTLGLEEIAKMRKEMVTDKQTTIEKLSQEILERQTQIGQLSSEVTSGTVDCNRNESNFVATVDSVINKLKIDKETLNLIINE